MDRRFVEMRQDMDKRFEAADKRFERLERRLDRLMIWSFGLYVTGIGAALAALWHFLGRS